MPCLGRRSDREGIQGARRSRYPRRASHGTTEATLEQDFWAQRWSEGQTAFHEGRPNDLLVANIARLETKRPSRILVPLAGKSFDLRWLAERGHDVVGVEFVPQAIAEYFAEQGIEPARSELGGMPASSANGVTLVCGDMLAVTPEALGRFDVIYDRAALVALDPKTRARYVEVADRLLTSDGAILLIAFAYDQSKAPGPPWSVSDETVRSLYAGRNIEVLATRAVPTSPRLTKAGIPALEESAYRITR